MQVLVNILYQYTTLLAWIYKPSSSCYSVVLVYGRGLIPLDPLLQRQGSKLSCGTAQPLLLQGFYFPLKEDHQYSTCLRGSTPAALNSYSLGSHHPASTDQYDFCEGKTGPSAASHQQTNWSKWHSRWDLKLPAHPTSSWFLAAPPHIKNQNS